MFLLFRPLPSWQLWQDLWPVVSPLPEVLFTGSFLVFCTGKRSSTIFCSQFWESEWFQQICSGESTLAVAIIDCISYDSYKINIEIIDLSKGHTDWRFCRTVIFVRIILIDLQVISVDGYMGLSILQFEFLVTNIYFYRISQFVQQLFLYLQSVRL